MIDAHRAAFEYEWRARFHLPLDVVGKSMTWGEAWRHTRTLAGDPSSYVAAAVAGWEHPLTREALVLMDLFDLQHLAANPKRKPKPYPRPWPDRTTSRPRPTVSPERAIAALRGAGHTAALPERFQHLET